MQSSSVRVGALAGSRAVADADSLGRGRRGGRGPQGQGRPSKAEGRRGLRPCGAARRRLAQFLASIPAAILQSPILNLHPHPCEVALAAAAAGGFGPCGVAACGGSGSLVEWRPGRLAGERGGHDGGLTVMWIKQRGGALIQKRGRSSAASTTVSIVDVIRSLVNPTPEGDWFSSGVYTTGNPYGIAEDIVFSMPCRSRGDGDYELVKDVMIDDFLWEQIKKVGNRLKRVRLNCLLRSDVLFCCPSYRRDHVEFLVQYHN